MNKIHFVLVVSLAAALASLAIGCGDSTVTPIDAGGHPDLGGTDAGHDSGSTGVDLGTDTGVMPVDMGMIDGGPDSGPVDGGAGHYTEAGCFTGTPVIMTDFLNHCTTTSTPATPRPTPGTRTTLLYADGGVPPL